MSENKFLGLSRMERELLSVFSAKEKVTIGVYDVIQSRNCSKTAAHNILSRLAKKGWLQRIKQGVYTIVPLSALTGNPAIEEVWTLGVSLFEPAYISGWSAAEHWDLTEQIFNSVSIVTQKPQRKIIHEVSGIRFRTRILKKEQFFGTNTIWFGSNKVEVADQSKLIIDILDMPEFGGGGRHTIDIVKAYWESEEQDSDKILEYALRYGKGTVLKRLGFLAEMNKAPVSSGWLMECKKNISTGISNLDPNSSSRGKIESKWNLRINMPL